MNRLPTLVFRTFFAFSLFLGLTSCAEGIDPAAEQPTDASVAAPEQALGLADGQVQLAPAQLELTGRLVPEEIACVHRSETPPTAEELAEMGFEHALTNRVPDFDEVSGGLSTERIDALEDIVELSPSRGSLGPPPTNLAIIYQADWTWYWSWLAADPDADCLPNIAEMNAGTDMYNPDTDGDGWFDGPCNERRSLTLEWVKAHDEQEDIGSDEHYWIVDDIRFPSGDLDGEYSFDDGQSRSPNLRLTERTRGVNRTSYLRNVRVEGWEDDFEITNTWTVDDLLYTIDIDLGAYTDGQVFTIRKIYDDWDYELRFRVDIDYFADPNPTTNGDSDRDGILESAEYLVARDFGGITDPTEPDILVEVDWMSGHGLRTQAKRLVATRLFRHGYYPYIHRHQSLSVDGCLSRAEARALYNNNFSFRNYNAFRYAVLSEVIWNDASGVAIGDTFFMDDSTWWINNGVLAQAGTFIHELGHTMSLTQSTFRLIDTIAWLSYDSAMNYTFQPTMVDYSNDGAGGSSSDHDDWEDVDPSYGMKYSFGLTTGDSACN